MRTDYQFLSSTVKSYVELRLQPREDKYYLIEIVNDPRGLTHFEQPTSTRRTRTIPRTTAKCGPSRRTRCASRCSSRRASGRSRGASASKSRPAASASIPRCSTTASRFAKICSASAKSCCRAGASRSATNSSIALWLLGGVDDILSSSRRDYFVGVQLRFNDEDLKSDFAVRQDALIPAGKPQAWVPRQIELCSVRDVSYAAAMSAFRVALANLRYPATRDESVLLVEAAIERAAGEQARLVCFPECYVPGYRGLGHEPPAPDAVFLERAWETIAAVARRCNIAAVVGTERVVETGVYAAALVIDRHGRRLGFQDKVRDRSVRGGHVCECHHRPAGFRHRRTQVRVAICHEGWRYPETVRWPAQHGAQVVFHPHLHKAEPGGFAPSRFADPANTFHEKAALCRAAENTCYFATVNYASAGAPTTSAVASPDGTLLGHHPYGEAGLFIADLELSAATCQLARRYRQVVAQPP